ncbi:hypothetical protein EI77_02663 [Prosthecobacter fusiformis]|uniref:Uncharacterized protein n=1 Tax=Prosthecobacter fusiformis TaxID=48464 RepID=A0A4R7RZN7_9BACT|nr:hypothetical protein [Prosthecobacter fusiformis]TDU70616.1 hypothetical protein EI77_02663 [Prosthecobacter fusiformis]
MILCLESSLLGGYLTNEVPGLVTGMLHVAGSKQPLRVELVGNFLRDIAGCRVDLHNPLPHGDLDEVAWLSPHQHGFNGVMTASYRVAKLPRRRSAGQTALPEPQGLKNLLFLEWFNQQSQRILIQSWHLQMRVSAPRWQMSEQEEASLLRQARARRKHFLLNQRGTQDRASALHAPGMPDPFEPHDLSTGNPFTSLGDAPASSPQDPPKSSHANPARRSQALAQELRRFEQLLVFNEEVRTRPAVMHLLSTVADLTAHLVHVLRQFSESKTAHWNFLIVDLEQSLPLFGAALNATDKMVQHASPGTDQEWLAMVQACLLNIELRMRELLTMLR